MGWWSSIFKQRAQDWIYARLNPEQVPESPATTAVNPESAYVRVILKSIRVVDVRRGLSRFYGTVHSSIGLPHRSGEVARFNRLTTPEALKDVDPAHLDRVIAVGPPLFGPVPYRGGVLDVEVGLFSIKSADLAGPFLAVLEKLSTLGGVSFLSAALPFAEPLTEGINLLTGGSDASVLEIGLAVAYQPVETGYYVVMRAPKGQIDTSTLKLTPIDFKLVDGKGQSVSNYPYMVLEIAASPKREDWFTIPELHSAHRALRDDVRRSDYDAAKQSLIVFKRMALTCDDLLISDGQRVAKIVEDEVNQVLAATQTAGGGARELCSLDSLPLYPKP